MNYHSLFSEVKKMIPNIKENDFEFVAQNLKVIHLKKNELWEEEGKIAQILGFVNSGILRQFHTKDGLEFTTDFFVENEFAGNYISYQNQIPAVTSTAAIEPCELFVMPFKDFESFYKSIPSSEQVSKIVGDKKTLQLFERNNSLLMDSPEERYYKLLEEKPNLINRVPQYLIAQYLGIRPESLSRIRKRHKL